MPSIPWGVLRKVGICFEGAIEILPLTPDRITEGRAENIAHFFKEWKDAQDDFITYYKHEKNQVSQ